MATTTMTNELLSSESDVCPVCKTMRYLNRNLEFLINPECYHPMCSGCVDRIFNDGPNQCPHAGCHRTLRRRGFRTAFFSNLRVEREVDIRRRVAAVFNKAEDDFETLDDYNSYLERVESLTNDLVNGADAARARADRELIDWEASHRADIERKRRASHEAENARTLKLATERDATRRRRLDAVREEEDERQKGVQLREEMLDSLAAAESGRDTARTVVKRIILKRRGQQRPDTDAADAAPAPSLSIRGLKDRTRKPAADSGLDDPFAAMEFVPTRYSLDHLAEYSSELTDSARDRDEVRAGGYNVDDYICRALFDAFAGLGVSVADEKDGRAGTVDLLAVADAAEKIAAVRDADNVF